MTYAFTIAKVVGLTGAAWLSGNIAALSLISVPAIIKSVKEDGLSSAHGVKLWRSNYEAGRAQNPPIALASATSLAYCAWTTRGLANSRTSRSFLVAATLTICIVPYTIAVMRKTNDGLLEFAKKTEKEELSDSQNTENEHLLQQWMFLNGMRSILPFAGAVVAGVVILA